jgi:hypothetical protein
MEKGYERRTCMKRQILLYYSSANPSKADDTRRHWTVIDAQKPLQS